MGKSIADRKSAQSAKEASASSPRSLRRILGIFDAIARAPEGLSLADLSVRINSPKSSLLTFLRPLTADGYLVHAGTRYLLGKEIFALAASIMSARKFSSLMRVFMEELLDRCRETVILATIDRDSERVSYVDVLESPQSIRYVVPAGVTRPLYTSAAGQLLLAYQDQHWRDRYLKKTKLVALTDRTITDVRLLRRKLEAIRRDGLSFSDAEAVQGAAGVAAPIFDANGEMVAALLIGAPSDRAGREGENWSEIVKEVAAKASHAMGYTVRPDAA